MKRQEFFDTIGTEEQAYWFGFFCADGCIYPNGKQVCFYLSSKDKLHLDKLASIFNVSVRIKTSYDKRTRKNYEHVRCLLSSKYLCNSILDKDVPKQKTKVLNSKVFDYIPLELVHHFIRGYFDGDGGISQKKNGLFCVYFVGTYEFVQFIKSILVNRLSIRNTKIIFQKCHKIQWSSKYEILRIKEWMYKDASVWMERKKDIFDRVALNKKKTSKYKGVYKPKGGKSWRARLFYDGKTRVIGSFETEELAAMAYDQRAKEVYGNNAVVNIYQ